MQLWPNALLLQGRALGYEVVCNAGSGIEALWDEECGDFQALLDWSCWPGQRLLTKECLKMGLRCVMLVSLEGFVRR